MEREIRDLKAKLNSIELVHAMLIGTLSKFMVTLLDGSVNADELMKGVRQSVSIDFTSRDPALAERMQLLTEQYIDDAVHLVEHCMKSLDRGR